MNEVMRIHDAMDRASIASIKLFNAEYVTLRTDTYESEYISVDFARKECPDDKIVGNSIVQKVSLISEDLYKNNKSVEAVTFIYDVATKGCTIL